jgi:hypothetical protein
MTEGAARPSSSSPAIAVLRLRNSAASAINLGRSVNHGGAWWPVLHEACISLSTQSDLRKRPTVGLAHITPMI